MVLYRFTNIKYARALDGKGASLNGGRWNSINVPMIYASSTASLAALELLRRFKPRQIPASYCLVEYRIEGKVGIKEIEPATLPTDWNSIQHNHKTQRIGDKFVQDNKDLLLKVPSVILPMELHFNINPRHRDMEKFSIAKVLERPLDLRLFVG